MHQESPVYSQFPPDYGYADKLIKYIVDKDQFGIVAENDERIVGVMLGRIGNIVYTTHQVAQECMLYVHPEHRNGRTALRFISEFESWAYNQGVEDVVVGVSAGINADLVCNMYHKLGYQDFSNSFRKHLN